MLILKKILFIGLVSFFLSQSQAIKSQDFPSAPQFSSILEEIQIQIERGNLTRASHLLKLLLERNPPRELRPLLRAITGNLALRQGNLSRAIAIYDELLLESFQGNENRLTWLNNYVKALLEREKIYLIQAKEDMETKEDFLSLARADREKARHLTRKAFKLLETGKTEAEIRTRLNLIELNDERGNRDRLERDILSLPLYATKVEFLLELAAQSREPLPLLQEAVAVAQKLDYPRSLSWAFGTLGNYYEKKQQYTEALSYSHQAQLVANEALDWSQLAWWQWQAARNYRHLGELDKAMAAYRLAVKSLQRLRQDLVGNSVSQSLYIEVVEPILRDFLAILLESHQTTASQEAIEILKLNQLAELDRYFRDICQITPEENLIRDKQMAVVYTVVLAERFYTIVEFADGTHHVVATPILEAELKGIVLNWRKNLTNRFTQAYRQESQELYKLIIEPLEPKLIERKISQLVFVQD